ncbi:hypothetical protein ACDI62_03925 [Klebsiella pneumoniae]|uniref:hypothetical protein n=1 Tax=Klebsiella pneumoniae complex TaxID=3390273 RepID=UPI0027D30F23|nr:hypothetical protein [Klebsiella quasipneumoniae]
MTPFENSNYMKYFYLIALSSTIFSVQAETFPAMLSCDTGEQITLKVTGPEQRLTYTSSLYGTFHGYLDVFKGESTERQYEALANIHGSARYMDNPLHFTLIMKRTNGEIVNDSIIYQYTYVIDEQIINEKGHCIPMKDGGFIEGSKNY